MDYSLLFYYVYISFRSIAKKLLFFFLSETSYGELSEEKDGVTKLELQTRHLIVHCSHFRDCHHIEKRSILDSASGGGSAFISDRAPLDPSKSNG